MRDSITGLWLMSIVIVFMMILIAYISISINYSTAYRTKTVMVTKMEQYDGFSMTTVSELNNIMSGYGYKSTGYCSSDDGNQYFGVTGTQVTAYPTTKQNYCVYREYKAGDSSNGEENKYYYSITLFFGFSLPVLGEIYTFKVSGETGAIYYPSSSDLFNGNNTPIAVTTTTGTAEQYTITINVNNGTASESSFTLTSSGRKNIYITPNDGYKLTSDSVTCTNITPNVYTAKNRITLSKATANATCTVDLALNTSSSTTFMVYKGVGDSDSLTVTYPTSVTSKKKITGTVGETVTYNYTVPTGYHVASSSPDCGTYSNDTWTATVATTDQTCSLNLEPNVHTLKITGLSTEISFDIYYAENKTITLSNVNLENKKLVCNSKSVTLNKSSSTSSTTGYAYYFDYKLRNDEDVTCTIS